MPLPFRSRSQDHQPSDPPRHRHYPRKILALHAFNTAVQTSGACTFAIAATLSTPPPHLLNTAELSTLRHPRLTYLLNRTVVLSSRIVPVFALLAVGSSLTTSYYGTNGNATDIEAWKRAGWLLRDKKGRAEVFDKQLWSAGVVGGLVMGALAARRGRLLPFMSGRVGMGMGFGTAVLGGIGVGVGGVGVGRGVCEGVALVTGVSRGGRV